MYRTIDAAFWTDSKVRKLSTSERLLFLYLITNPHTHVSGLYYLPDLVAQHESGLSARVLKTAKENLSGLRIALFDEPRELVWVVKMFRFQGSGQKNTLSAAHHLSKDVHNSCLINAFIKEYPHVEPFVKNRVSADATPENEERRTEPENGERIGEGAAAPPATKTKRMATSSVPEDFEITAVLREWARTEGFTDSEIARETPKMIDHFRSKGVARSDWPATWRNWMRNSRTFNDKKPGGQRGQRFETSADKTRRSVEEFRRRNSGEIGEGSSGNDSGSGDARGVLRRVE